MPALRPRESSGKWIPQASEWRRIGEIRLREEDGSGLAEGGDAQDVSSAGFAARWIGEIVLLGRRNCRAALQERPQVVFAKRQAFRFLIDGLISVAVKVFEVFVGRFGVPEVHCAVDSRAGGIP